MSKNLTRKGLVLGTAVALTSSAFAGAPAFAVDPVTLDPTTGTQYSTIIGETFSLTSLFTDAAQQAGEELKFLVTDPSEKLHVAAGNNTDLAGKTLDATTKSVVIDNNVTTYAGDVLTFKASAAAVTANAGFSVTVQAWLDFDADNTIDAGESTSAVRTVNFVKLADAGVVTTLTAPILAASTANPRVYATVGFASSINVSQLTPGNYTVGFAKVVSGALTDITSATTIASGAFTAGEAVVYDSTNGNFKVQVSTTDGAAVTDGAATAAAISNGTYGAQAISGGAGIGSISYKAVAEAVAGANPVVSAVANSNVRTGGSNIDVRTGTKSVTVSTPVLTSAGASVGAGVSATVRVAKNGALSTATDKVTTITAGGKTLTNSAPAAGYIEFTATTNADGKIVFDLTSSTGAKDDTVDVTVTVAGPYAGTETIDWVDATISASGLVDLGQVGEGTPVFNVKKGGSYTLNYALVDSYGALVTDAGYRVAVTLATTAGGTAFTKQASFSNGLASVSFTDDSTTNGIVTATAAAEVLDPSNGNYVTSLSTTKLTAARSINTTKVHVLAANTASAVSATATSAGSGVVSLVSWANGDVRVPNSSFVDPQYGAGYFTISGTVTDADGIYIPGAVVTVSAADVAFSDGNKFTTGSITVQANATGVYSVKAYSHSAATKSVTVTSGSATKTVSAAYTNTVALTSTSVFAVNVDNIVKAGRTVQIVFNLKDKFGNLIKATDADWKGLTLSYVGPGYLTSALPTALTDGTASVLLVTGAGDAGVGTFTLYNKGVDKLNTTDAQKADDVNVTKTVLVGVSASVSAGSKKANVVVKNAEGLTVTVVSGTKSTTKIATSDSYKVSLSKLTSGSKTVKVYVNDILVASKKVTVKK